jgi:RNA 3'-terminal phosphate cyclase (ATP)
MSTDTMIDLDGSFGEGGGQILRTSLALSLLTGIPFHLRNVRARRQKPGLQPQHLQSVQAAAALGQAKLRGASLGSCDLSFEPGTVGAGTYRFDIGTAGATGLVLHTLYLPLMLRGAGPSEITLVGGTHVSTSPSFHFLDTTWRAYLEAIGLRISLRMDRPGFYPRGGGIVRAFLQPCAAPRGLSLLERGEVQVQGTSAIAGLDRGIARRQARRAAHRLRQHDVSVHIDEESWEGGPGSVLVLELNTSPAPTVFVGLGARGKPAETVADETVEEVMSYLAAGPALVDAHSADQIVLPLALAEGPSEYTVAAVTSHLLTNIAVIGRFLQREIICEGEEGQPGRVRIR